MNTKNGFSTLLAVLITAVAVGVSTGVISYSSAISKKDLEIEVLKEELSQVKEEGVDETANWKTYRNDKYGFSFKYPEGWEVSENEPGDTNYKHEMISRITSVIFPEDIRMYPEKNIEGFLPRVSISVYMSVYDYVNRTREKQKDETLEDSIRDVLYKNQNINRIEISREKAFEYEYSYEYSLDRGIRYTITIEHSSRVYEIDFPYNEGGKSSLTPVENQILSTFQFTK